MRIPELFERVQGEDEKHTAWFVGGKRGRKWVQVKSLIFPLPDDGEQFARAVNRRLYQRGFCEYPQTFGREYAWSVEVYHGGPSQLWAILVEYAGFCQEIYCNDFPTALNVLSQLLPLTLCDLVTDIQRRVERGSPA